MYLVSGLHGQATSFSPWPSGAPTVCTHGTNAPSVPSSSTTALPIRVMVRMLVTTYGESEISIPMWAIGEPSGPIENGITYMVRPFMQPLNKPSRVLRILAGSSQLLVGPASSFLAEQMEVRSSTRATSEGSEKAR